MMTVLYVTGDKTGETIGWSVNHQSKYHITEGHVSGLRQKSHCLRLHYRPAILYI